MSVLGPLLSFLLFLELERNLFLSFFFFSCTDVVAMTLLTFFAILVYLTNHISLAQTVAKSYTGWDW
jgi:hypothetical protein